MPSNIANSNEHRRQSSGGIREVAKVAGVSIATVSRVFNRPQSVTSETRARVIEAADQLFYVPDNAARALSSQRSLRVGALIPTIDDSIFARFVTALQRELGDAGYGLILGINEFDEELEFKKIRSLIESGVDAMVLCGVRRNQEVYDLLRTQGIPYLLTNVYLPASPHPSVGYDNHEGMAKAARYLIEQGHRRFGVIDFPNEANDRAEMRAGGVVAALEEQGLVLPANCRIERPYSFEDGRIGLRTLLESAPETTAVLCGNDVLAIGALFEANDRNIDVPGQLSIIGFDNLDLAAQITPALTTVDVPTATMGKRTAETLLHMLANAPAPHATPINTNLIIRGTTGPAPK
ncbi:MAG: LacI family DNA-binding transcriptional regulator [Rhodospirillaceae bacterium]|nr:LacI family DNA-binding transcriptional regulator [Rhodospirillaceae bacterium]MBT7509766.1 LacI family DNA-binding transcriptional regulator [Rhodospirillaceae bacterium]